MIEYNQDYYEDGHHRAQRLLKDEVPVGRVKWRKHKSSAKKNRTGHPGFNVEQHTLDKGEYIWFKATRGDDAAAGRAFTKPFTYFRVPGERWCIKVPVSAIRLTYKEAADIAKRVYHDGPRVVHARHKDARNERVAYHVDQYGDTWVGATLNTFIELSGGGCVHHIDKNALPNMCWSSLVVSL